MTIEITLSDLHVHGDVRACDSCGNATYSKPALELGLKIPANAEYKLPAPYSVANKRHWVEVRGARLCLCANCRYDKYAAY